MLVRKLPRKYDTHVLLNLKSLVSAQNLLDEFFKVQMDLDNDQVEALERMAVVAKQLSQEYSVNTVHRKRLCPVCNCLLIMYCYCSIVTVDI